MRDPTSTAGWLLGGRRESDFQTSEAKAAEARCGLLHGAAAILMAGFANLQSVFRVQTKARQVNVERPRLSHRIAHDFPDPFFSPKLAKLQDAIARSQSAGLALRCSSIAGRPSRPSKYPSTTRTSCFASNPHPTPTLTLPLSPTLAQP